jgi:hypothetical protein
MKECDMTKQAGVSAYFIQSNAVNSDHCIKGVHSTARVGSLVFLPGFQKGRDIEASQGKGQRAVLAKKGQFASYKEKLEKWTEFTTFSINKMFSHKF